MASAKIAQLVIRTLAKPISNQIKVQAKQHERFRSICIGLAQRMYQTEVRMRTNLLGEPAKHVRPLSETRAIENGANALAEGFLFSVAAGMIIAEAWRSSRNQTKRRDAVDDSLDVLNENVEQLSKRVDSLQRMYEERLTEQSLQYDEIARILQRIVEIGLRGGWVEFEGTPLPLPRIDLVKKPPPSSDPQDSGADSSPDTHSPDSISPSPA
ncbi:OPA3-domain-containing protein [Trametes gibbosa]|nr:OPA3-domain-containing protein [Trametes gibbosa]